jgi:hypothetical protein
MAEDWYLIEVVSEPVEGGTPCYHMRLRKPNGDDIIHVIPHAQIDIRAGEYGIDHTTPSGKQQVIDLILHEMHGPAPKHLWEQPTIAQALDAHVKRCEQNKVDRVNVIWSGNPKARGKLKKLAAGPPDPAQVLLDHVPDPACVERYAARVKHLRGRLGLEKIDSPSNQSDKKYYDPSIRRRGLTVSLLDG